LNAAEAAALDGSRDLLSARRHGIDRDRGAGDSAKVSRRPEGCDILRFWPMDEAAGAGRRPTEGGAMLNSNAMQFYRDKAPADETRKALPEPIAPPPYRRLRAFAFDPSLSLQLETASINHTVLNTPWEGDLAPGPRGEYLEVVDYDPASGCWYDPVDLNAVELVAQDGLAPSEGNPQFHQQMAYAVAMSTIGHFEHALGRPVFWAWNYDEKRPAGERDVYVQRLRIYPHATRTANAYYSPAKKALLFGYFPGPSGMVFSCLSHDIVAHETTHALLDGMNRRFIEDNNPDTLAFHEAFADLVALFQHFTLPEVMRHQIGKTRGDLERQSLLGELARQFGEATGRYGALRNAIGDWGPDKVWRPIEPDPRKLKEAVEPHTRGAILVAAVFGAFLAAYRARSADLVRLATAGTGVLPQGEIHPDLRNRLAGEASNAASDFLNICIRALDYLPPVDVTFGDYLRALVTADFDLVPNDKHGYRVALIESFRRWGIMPTGLRALSEEQLRWPFARLRQHKGWAALTAVAEEIRNGISSTLYIRDRKKLFDVLTRIRKTTHEYIQRTMSDKSDAPHKPEFMRVTGLNISESNPPSGITMSESMPGQASFEVHAVRPALRVSPNGVIVKQLIMIITQRRILPVFPDDPESETFDFRGGSTLIFDLEGEPSLRYAITKPIDDEERLAQIREYRRAKTQEHLSLRDTYFGRASAALRGAEEVFCMLHS
jgi:hypothetical protein